MAYENYCRKMESLKYKIKQENTGTAKELAEKLGISRRTLFNYLEKLRDEGSVIKFDKNRRSYYSDNQQYAK